MRMKLRVARKIERATSREAHRAYFAGEKPRYRHTGGQVTRALFVINKHVKWRIPAEIDGKVVMRAVGGLANEALAKSMQDKELRKKYKDETSDETLNINLNKIQKA